MSKLIFRLRNVPEDEAEAVRRLLDEHALDWYETSAGNWGIAMPGLWVSNEEDAPGARALIDTYQQERSISQRQLYDSQSGPGFAGGLLRSIRERPLQVLGVLLFCLFILYVSINPFLQMVGYSKQ